VLTGKDALEKKLIDGVGQIEDAYQKARELGVAPGASIVMYVPEPSGAQLLKLLSQSSQSSRANIEVNLTQKLLPPLEPGKLYLLPDYYAQ
jgi:protease-4